MQVKEAAQDIALRLQAVIDHAINGIITIDKNGIIESINPAAAELFGYDQEEVIGNNINILMPEPHHSHHDQYLQKYERTKEPKIIGIGREVYGIKKNGEKFPFRLSVSEVKLNDRTIYTGILHDMSEIRNAEDKLIQLNEKLEAKVEERTKEIERVVNRLLKTNQALESKEEELQKSLEKERDLSELKSRFVSMASHEFRTPLSTVQSSAALIKMYHKENQQKQREKHVDKIRAAVSHLTGILNDFLSISKLEEGKVGPLIVDFDPKLICIEIMDEMEGMLKEEQHFQFTSQMEKQSFHNDRAIFKNILFNLFSNAIKYSGEGATIECNLAYYDDLLEIVVKDHGIGIPYEEQKYLFDRFFRASNVESIQGTGLGLNIVYHYLQVIHGSIRFESQRGKGSTFFITIPNQKP
jgi:PAS domain S-box-containing protein